MEACNKHASTDKTRDDEEDKGKGPVNNVGKSNNGGGHNNNNSNNHNSNNNQHERPYGEGNSDFMANTNTGFQRPRTDEYRGNNGNNNSNNNFRGPPQVFRMPCPYHSKMGRPSNHTLEQCVDLQRWKNNEIQRALHGGNRGGGPGPGGNPANRPPPNVNSGQGNNGGNNQTNDGQGGFQQNPKQLGQYHIHTIHATKIDRKLIQRAVNAVSPAVPRYLKWSKYPVTWSREDHPPVVENPGLLALVVAPQVGGYSLNKVLMDEIGRAHV